MLKEGEKWPYVSVIVPCYNYALYVGDAIRSILSQNYPEFELIVVDDGSVDDSAEVIEKALSGWKEYPGVSRVEFIRQPNQGVSAAVNSGLKSALGKYVATFDADDLMPQGRLRLQVQHMEGNPEVGCVGGIAVRIDETGKKLPKKNKDRNIKRYSFDAALESALVVGGGMALFRKEALDRVGGYDPEIKIQDFQITLKVAASDFFIDVLPDVVTYYRKHEGSLSSNYKMELKYGMEVIDEYKFNPNYEKARVKLIVKALRMASIHDKTLAWSLIKQVPFKYWDKTMWKRFRYFLFKRG